jgi:membrane fusion protein (multidrug efflux system)
MRPLANEQPLVRHRSILVSLGAIALVLCAGCGRDGGSPAGALPPPPVKVMTVEPRDLPLYREFVGQTRGRQDVDVRARVQGYVQTINFRPGTSVKAGDLLFTLDKRPYEAALAQAKASEAQLRSQYQQARSDAQRYEELAKSGVISRQQAEQTASQAKASAAALDAQQAVVKGREVDLTFTEIRAPISGRIGLTPYSVGDLVGTASNAEKALATISALDSVRVRFAISETDYLGYIRDNPEAAVDNGASASRKILQLSLADGSVYPQPGYIVTADNAIDPATATLTVEAEFPNPDGVLRTGQFAKVRVSPRVLRDAIAIPARAVQEQQGIASVMVVGADNRVEARRVEIADRGPDFWAITAGLTSGERVIVEGLTKAAPGVEVKPEEVAYNANPNSQLRTSSISPSSAAAESREPPKEKPTQRR